MRFIRGSAPLYAQVENELRARISSGKLAINDSVTAKDICKEFGVSLITAYHALTTLSNEGLIRLEPGKKTIVVSGEENKSVKVIGSIDDIKVYARETVYKLLELQEVGSDAGLSKALNVTPGSRLINFTAIRLLGETPFAFISSYVVYEIASSVTKEDFLSHSSVLSVIENKSRVKPTKTEQEIKAKLANKKIAKSLNIRIGSPILWIERLYYADTIPIIFSITQANGEVYPYRINLLRANNK